jgi:hypothetical protein
MGVNPTATENIHRKEPEASAKIAAPSLRQIVEKNFVRSKWFRRDSTNKKALPKGKGLENRSGKEAQFQ